MALSTSRTVRYIRSGSPGKDGERGPALRGPQMWDDCPVGYHFQSGSPGEEYKDIVIHGGNYYSCTASHTKTADNPPLSPSALSGGLWQLADQVETVATRILLATYALIENLGASALEMKDPEGNIIFSARDGNVVCRGGMFENIIVSGSLRSPFTNQDSSLDSYYSDNVVLLGTASGGWSYAYSLPWGTGQSGRRVTILNYKWGETESVGSISIAAPQGKYFYEDGIAKTSLRIEREAVELIGYGTPQEFYGWIVLRRINLMGNYSYGKELKVIAYGSVDSAGNIDCRTFDGSTLTATKSAQYTGRYTIGFPSKWFANDSDCGVILTPIGHADGSAGPIKATLIARAKTGITIETSDDSTPNDGEFDFIIYNRNEWVL